MTAPLLLQFGLPILSEIVGSALKQINHPAAQGAAASLGKLGEILTAGKITPEQITEANRHVERMAELKISETQAAYEQVNESLRAEVSSEDAYVRRMRPTFGYLIAFTWAAQMFAIAYIIVFKTSESSVILQAMESLDMIWGIGLSVLGVYVYKRSEEKKISPSEPARSDLPAKSPLRKPLQSLRLND